MVQYNQIGLIYATSISLLHSFLPVVTELFAYKCQLISGFDKVCQVYGIKYL